MAVRADRGTKAEKIARFKECYGDFALIDKADHSFWPFAYVSYVRVPAQFIPKGPLADNVILARETGN